MPIRGVLFADADGGGGAGAGGEDFGRSAGFTGSAENAKDEWCSNAFQMGT